MKMKRTKKALSLFLCMVLIVAMALVTTGCSDDAGKETAAQTTAAAQATTEASAVEATAAQESQAKETDAEEIPTAEANSVTVLGEGEKWFNFGVVDIDKNETWFEIHTDAETVGEALIELELIAGDEGPYGLYVKTVNGITADYDKDKVYWAFYVNDEYGTSGVELTEIEDGAIYSFRIAK